jgi:hypothetical protein
MGRIWPRRTQVDPLVHRLCIMEGIVLLGASAFSGKEMQTMARTVAGIYKDGRIELLETPIGVREGRVLVTLVEMDKGGAAPRYLQPGKYQTGRMSTEEDFKIAEWYGEEEFDGG